MVFYLSAVVILATYISRSRMEFEVLRSLGWVVTAEVRNIYRMEFEAFQSLVRVVFYSSAVVTFTTHISRMEFEVFQSLCWVVLLVGSRDLHYNLCALSTCIVMSLSWSPTWLTMAAVSLRAAT